MDLNRVSDVTGLSIPELADKIGKSPDTLYRWNRGESHPSKSDVHFINELVQQYLLSTPKHSGSFRFIDLFAGIGGFRLGFESIGGECVFTSEWDKFAQRTYLRNFQPDHGIAGDITKIHESEIPEHDVLLAGFPCQPFSIAGVSKKASLGRPHGFLDVTQGTLFFDVARIIQYHRPRFFLLENVKNLLSHDKRRTFAVIHKTLTEELGYHVQWRVIDAAHWVPQHRERIFIVGFREPTDFDFSDMPLPDRKFSPTLKTVLHPEDGSEEPEEPYTTGPMAEVASKYVLTERLWAYLQEYAERHKRRGNGFGFGLVGPEDISRTISARYYKDGSEILVRREEGIPRRLTPREAARLMGFDSPDRRWEIPVSDVQAYRQFGNAVVVPVVKHIAHHVKPYIQMLSPEDFKISFAQLDLDGRVIYRDA